MNVRLTSYNPNSLRSPISRTILINFDYHIIVQFKIRITIN